jgi:hypothetical protein
MAGFIHPDDEESPRFGTWADDFNTFDEACIFYGAETRASLEAEYEEIMAEANIDHQDFLEANGGPKFVLVEIPF